MRCRGGEFSTVSRRLLACALGLCFCASAGGDPATKKVSFQEAVRIAVENSPSLNTARRELDVREMEYVNSYSVFLPSLDLAANHGLRGSNHVEELSLQLTESLYDNGVSLAKYDSARYQKEIAELSYRNERDKLVLDLATEYMRYSLAANLTQVQEQQFNIINKQYQSVANQYHQGIKTRRDYLRFKTELRRAEIELQNSRATVEKSRFELMRWLGFDVSRLEPFDFQPIGVDVESVGQVPLKGPDLANHYRYRIAELQRKTFDNDVYIVRRDYWPRVSLTAGAAYHTGDYLHGNAFSAQNEETSWNALLTLNFNLWDWGIRRRNVSLAEAKRTQSENAITSNLNTFAAENAKMMLEMKQSSRNFTVARELLDLETKSYGFLDAEYRNGKASYLDVIVGLRDLLSAKVQMYSSYFDLRGQLLRYRYHEGRLYESVSEK